MHACMHADRQAGRQAGMYVCVYVCMCVCVYVCMCVYVYVICMCMCMCMYMYVYVCVCMCMYMHVGMYMHVCMYVCLRHVCMSASSRDTVGKHGQAVSNSNATATGISGFEGWREQLYKKKIRCLGLDIRRSTKIRLTITKVRSTSFLGE